MKLVTANILNTEPVLRKVGNSGYEPPVPSSVLLRASCLSDVVAADATTADDVCCWH